MENLSKKPVKGILKSSSSFEQTEVTQRQVSQMEKDIKWDEMNILQTLHPPDKDYGHMKIEEPKTPFNYYAEDHDGEHMFDPESLAAKLSKNPDELPKVMTDDVEEEEDDDENLTEEEKEKKKEFEYKRKNHYNEFHAVKLARKLLEEEDDDDDEEDAAKNGNHGTDKSNDLQEHDNEEPQIDENR